jgi:uncharacterized membrane protein
MQATLLSIGGRQMNNKNILKYTILVLMASLLIIPTIMVVSYLSTLIINPESTNEIFLFLKNNWVYLLVLVFVLFFVSVVAYAYFKAQFDTVDKNIKE